MPALASCIFTFSLSNFNFTLIVDCGVEPFSVSFPLSVNMLVSMPSWSMIHRANNPTTHREKAKQWVMCRVGGADAEEEGEQVADPCNKNRLACLMKTIR